MATSYATGVDGDVTFVTGHGARFDSWTGRFGQRTVNITGYDSDGFEENIGGLKFGEGSCTGTPKYGAASTAPGTATLSKTGGTATFQIATGCTIAATCIVTDVNLSSDVNGAARISFNFRTSGTVTETWAVA